VQCTLSNSNGNGFGDTIFSGNHDPREDIYWQWTDFNGDGMNDFCGPVFDSLFPQKVRCIVSTGTGFSDSFTSDTLNVGRDTGRQWVDVNGDGRADFCRAENNTVQCTLSTGVGFGDTITSDTLNVGQDTGRQWVDVNGDGRADFCRVVNNTVQCTLSTGVGFGETITSGTIDVGQDTGRQWVDVNGDGKADYCRVVNNTVECTLSTGTGFSSYPITSGTIDIGYDTGRQWTDFNGDGKADYCRRVGDTNLVSSYVQCLTSLSPDNAAIDDLLVTVTNPIGGITTITYTPSSASQNTNLPFVVQTVSSITGNDNNGNISTTNYYYALGYYDAMDREFRGFGYVQSRSANSAGMTSETWYYTDDDVYKGLPSMQVISDVPSNVYAATFNTYQTVYPYTGVSFPYPSNKRDIVFDGTTTRDEMYNDTWHSRQHKEASATYYPPDAYGNITHKHFDGDVSISGDERDEYTDYYYNTSKWIVSLPSHTYINDSTGAKKAETWFDYDTSGNLTTKTLGLVLGNKTSPNNPKIIYSSYRYGNPETITDARNYSTTISYYSSDNPTYTYPVSTTDPLAHVTSTKYDERFGKVTSVTDPNQKTTFYTYDPFGRIRTVTTPENVSALAYAWQETYYDGFGRTIQSRTPGPASQVIVQETVYNQLGQVWKTSQPYFEGVRPSCLSNNVSGCTVYGYDPLSRVTSITNPDTTYTTKSYMQGRATLIDANGHEKVEEKDVYGRLIKVEEYTGDEAHSNFALYATTTYTYDVLGNLTDVYDAQNNHTQITYDSLSRKINMNDPDMGYWTYSYDPNGNLAWQTDAKNQTIYFQYNPINQIRQKDYGTQKTLDSGDVVYKYDETFSTNYRGRLTSVTDASGMEKYYYDQIGRITTTTKTVDGTNYQIDTTYDELGRTASIRYPDNEVVGYEYDNGGNLTGVSGYATFGNYNALGQARNITYNNGVTTTRQYYSTNNRLSSITTNSPTVGGIQNMSYTYDNVGNVDLLTDNLDPNRTQDFTYDELNRLTSAVSNAYVATLGTNTISYQYNSIGNMILNSRVSGTLYTYWKDIYGTKPHAVYQAGSNTYQYDNNGNMTGGGGRTITYDYENRPTSIIKNGVTVISIYDYSGRRVKKIATGTTIYIGKLYECTGGNCVKYVFAGNMRIASQSSNHTYFYHSDHLGSSSIITDERGNKAQETYYYPFGETRYNSGNVTHFKFTGQEEDAETGLYYYGARYYDPVVGRFISPDSIVQAPFDPQTLNRYSYCVNNPVIYIDPTGHFTWKHPFRHPFSGIGHFFSNNWQIIVSVAIAAVSFYAAGEILELMSLDEVNGMCVEVSAATQAGLHASAGAVSGGLSSVISHGNIGLGMLTGAISGGIAKYAGTFMGTLDWGSQLAGRTAIGGITGGITAEIYGGNFKQGFIHGAETAAIGSIANDLWHDKIFPWIKNHIGVSWSRSFLGVGTQTSIGGDERTTVSAIDLVGSSLDIQLGDQPAKQDVVGEFGIGLGEHLGIGFYCFEASSVGCSKGGAVMHLGIGLGSPVYIGGDYAK
jgi:RHS repeat-associated protein